MNAREMHYDFKQKLNKIDSEKYRNLIVPEIDWKLNEAQEVFVKMIAEPRLASQLGFEKNQRTINDIRSIVINQTTDKGNCIKATVYDSSSFLAEIPLNYWFHVKSKAIGYKGTCKNAILSTTIQEHDNEAEDSPFDKSSFEWRHVNLRFLSEGIRMYTDGTFTIDWLCMDYIKKPRLIHNAQDYVSGTYTTLGGTVLTGSQSCELPEMTHKEIVDLAVLIAAGDMDMPDTASKQNKLSLDN